MNETMLKAVNDTNSDVYFYWGPISKPGYHKLSACIENQENLCDTAYLILTTYGGDPDAGYRIARALGHHYEKIKILIPDICKSAGTLVCIGASELILGDRGELGPLDIQLSKPDEMFESVSGLDILQALSALQDQVLYSFRSYLFDIRTSSQITTKIAAEIATHLAESYIAPIAAKIDPMTLGEHQRAIQIGIDYGERLNLKSNSLKPEALAKLVSNYPSHSFVIDRKEARELFHSVKSPEKEEMLLYQWARDVIESKAWPNDPIVIDLRRFFTQKEEVKDDQFFKENENSDEEGGYNGDPFIDEETVTEVVENKQNADTRD